ncbi:uncharacterized protein LOC114363442 [Ostrinia furnacalis]|nr:uncharacterized protein LOC114363442 [Ostrinia furnacalis]
MRSWLLCVLALAVVACTSAQHYNRYDNFNADSIIQNERILLAYYKCVMDKGPCTKDGKNFKRVLPETLTSACSRCSPKQKLVVRKLLLGIRAKSEPRFLELLDKYDPERLNREALYNFLVTGFRETFKPWPHHINIVTLDQENHTAHNNQQGRSKSVKKTSKMKLVIISLCLAAAVVAQEKYDSIDDNFDISEVLNNERLLNSYTKCLLDKGPCTPEVKKVKDKLPEALATRCAKCTDKQKQIGKQLAKEVKAKRPDLWKELVAHYDPEGKYQEAFQDYLKP